MFEENAGARVVLACAFVSASACVYPSDDPTGLELSWRFIEGNLADGEDGRRVRTCAGVDVETVEVGIQDMRDPIRRGTFEFACGEGYQTQTEFQTRASDVFIPLRPGDYEVELTAFVPSRREVVGTRQVDVLGRGLTVEPFEFRPSLVDWTISLAGLDACDEFSASLFYADPIAQLSHPPRSDEGDALPTRYREALATDRGLVLSSESTTCSTTLEGEHVIEALDPGDYRLEIVADARPCAFAVRIEEGARASVDLANLPCEG